MTGDIMSTRGQRKRKGYCEPEAVDQVYFPKWGWEVKDHTLGWELGSLGFQPSNSRSQLCGPGWVSTIL